MKKHLIVSGIVFVLLIVGLSGCLDNNSNINGIEEDENKNVEIIENDFLSTIRSIGNGFRNIDDVKDYNQSKYLKHREELNSYNTSLLDSYGEYAGSYSRVKNFLILGLEYITLKDWENAWWNIIYASGELFDINMIDENMWEIDVGLETLKDLLYSLKG